MEEEYKIIKDFENYEISNFGNIKNVKTGRILKKTIDGHGYHMVKLCKEGKKVNKKIHKLVGNAFIPNPLNKNCIDHKDGNRLNNNIDNLRYVTYQENNMNRKIATNNTSGFKGISFNKKYNKWHSYIKINGKLNYLGLFEKIEDAVNARVKKAEQLFGAYKNSCEKIININIAHIENLNIVMKNDEAEIAELEKELEAIINRK
jgi:hypothetical protein